MLQFRRSYVLKQSLPDYLQMEKRNIKLFYLMIILISVSLSLQVTKLKNKNYISILLWPTGGVTTIYMRALNNVESFCCERNAWIRGVATLPSPLSGHGAVTLPPASLMWTLTEIDLRLCCSGRCHSRRVVECWLVMQGKNWTQVAYKTTNKNVISYYSYNCVNGKFSQLLP